MKRRRPGGGLLDGSLDSFVDIVTNSLGILFLIAALTVLTSRHITIDLGVPHLKPAPREVDVGALYECRGNALYPIELDEIQELLAGSSALDKGGDGNVQKFNMKRAEIAHHSVRMASLGMFLVLELYPRERTPGLDILRRPRDRKTFENRLLRLDPKRHVVRFEVHPDCFETFREARRLTRGLKLFLRWEPLKRSPIRVFLGGFDVGPMEIDL